MVVAIPVNSDHASPVMDNSAVGVNDRGQRRSITACRSPRADGGVSLLWRGRASRKIEVRIAPVPSHPPTFIVSRDFVLEDEGLVDDPHVFVKNVILQYLR